MNEVSKTTDDLEADAIRDISRSLRALPNQDSQILVLEFVVKRLSLGELRKSQLSERPKDTFLERAPTAIATASLDRKVGEIPGIAKVTESGELKITIRDLKASSGLNAAVRLAHIAIHACESLLDRGMSSRNELTPILKQWRVYDGNTRAKIGSDKGILRDGDVLTLDAHARRLAEQFINDILDPSIEGRWKPA
jgi:hypothetical protein